MAFKSLTINFIADTDHTCQDRFINQNNSGATKQLLFFKWVSRNLNDKYTYMHIIM